jgi:hypothetical protein
MSRAVQFSSCVSCTSYGRSFREAPPSAVCDRKTRHRTQTAQHKLSAFVCVVSSLLYKRCIAISSAQRLVPSVSGQPLSVRIWTEHEISTTFSPLQCATRNALLTESQYNSTHLCDKPYALPYTRDVVLNTFLLCQMPAFPSEQKADNWGSEYVT